jgi:chromosome segregation ATPase
VSSDLLEPPVGAELAPIALDEFRATQDEFTEFFGDVFDQLQVLSLELFARHKCLEVSTDQKAESAETLAGYREAFQRTVEQLQQLHWQLQAEQQEAQQGWAEIRAGHQQFLDDHAELREIREGFRQIAGEFSGIKEDVERERTDLHDLYANVESQLARLTALAAALSEGQARPHDAEFAEILEHTRQQQAEWLQQRAALEAELEAMRGRAAEQAEALSEQKRLAGQQQAELAGELKRMRSLLETLASQVRGEPVAPNERTKLPPVDHAVLGTVLAQFEMLQRDITFRRTKRNTETAPGKTPAGS